MTRPFLALRPRHDRPRRRRPRLAWSTLTVLLAAALSSGPEGCSSRASRESPPPDRSGALAAPQSDGDLGGTLLCDPGAPATAGQPAREPEYYIAYSMNRKLRYYPEFAAAIGMNSVRTCDDARAFMSAYSKYFQQHPFFDSRLPLAPEALQPPVTPNDAPAAESAPVEKIFNGTATGPSGSDPFPVVEIHHDFLDTDVFSNGQPLPQRTIDCSGTFISKNFILTSAHCIGLLALTFPSFDGGVPTDASATRQWITSALWQISWPDAAGTAGGMMKRAVKAKTIVHPSYAGLLPPPVRVYPDAGPVVPDAGGAYDIALLWIDPWDNDAQLPADAAKSSWAVQLAAEDTLLKNWSLRMYGYGPTMNGGTATVTLTASGESQIPTGAQTIDPPQFVNIAIFDPTTDPGLCGGDSGGPLVREVRDPSGNLIDTVIVGVNSRRSADPFNSAAACPGGIPGQGGLFSEFARTDIASDFLKDIVTHWQPEGVQNVTENGQSSSYVLYHGASCQSDCTCFSNQVCFNPINDANSKASQGVCNNNVCDDCSCVQGQCVLQANADGGSNGTRDCPDGS